MPTRVCAGQTVRLRTRVTLRPPVSCRLPDNTTETGAALVSSSTDVGFKMTVGIELGIQHIAGFAGR